MFREHRRHDTAAHATVLAALELAEEQSRLVAAAQATAPLADAAALPDGVTAAIQRIQAACDTLAALLNALLAEFTTLTHDVSADGDFVTVINSVGGSDTANGWQKLTCNASSSNWPAQRSTGAQSSGRRQTLPPNLHDGGVSCDGTSGATLPLIYSLPPTLYFQRRGSYFSRGRERPSIP